MNEPLTWVACDGGPHAFIPEPAVPRWGGTCPPSDGRVVQAAFRWSGKTGDPASDYDAACDIDELVGLLRLDPETSVLVLGDEVPMSTWIQSPHFAGGIVVVPMCWPSPRCADAELIAVVESVPPKSFQHTGLQLRSSSGRFLLCAACDSAPNWIYPTLEVRLSPGTYRVMSAEVSIRGFELRLHALANAA
jgi:hypothetical protein